MARDVDYELIKKDLEGFDLQLKRFASHLESERRGQAETGKRVDQLVQSCQTMQKTLEKLDDIVRNGGRGLTMRVDRIEQKNDNTNAFLYKVLAVGGFLTGLASFAYQIFTKT